MDGSGSGRLSLPFCMATDGTRLREAREAVRWSIRTVAAELGCNETLVRRWEADGAAVPAPVLRWLTTLATAHSRHPAPTDWRIFARRDD